MLSPVIHPWYLLWLLPLFVMLHPVELAAALGHLHRRIFTAYGAGDQLYVWHSRDPWMQALSWGLSVLLAIWVLYYDPWTSPMFKNQWHVRQSWRRMLLTYQRWKRSRTQAGR